MWRFFLSRASAYLLNKNYRQALVDATKCLELGGPADSCRLTILECCVVLGQVAEGRIALQQLPTSQRVAVLANQLDQIEQLLSQSFLAADGKKYAEAEQSIER
jgi:hypothetical protein